MTSIDEALFKAYARRAQRASHSTLGGPHIRIRGAQAIDAATTGPAPAAVPDAQIEGTCHAGSDASATEVRRADAATLFGGFGFHYEVSTADPQLSAWDATAEPVSANLPDQCEERLEPEPASAAAVTDRASAAQPLTSPVALAAPSIGLAPTDSNSLAPPAATASRTFKAAWEVDGFAIPDVCAQIEQSLWERVQAAVAELQETCVPQHPIVCVNSWSRGEGRTTVAILLARALAKTGLSVILVDADFEQPALAERLSVVVEHGWDPSRALDDSLAECCVHSLHDRFTMLPLSSNALPDGNTAIERLKELAKHLAGHFQIVLLDTGPRGDAVGQLSGPELGAHLIVRDRRVTSDAALGRLIGRLEGLADVPVRVVENFADLRAQPTL
jgi:Mrp family chromosome partitioning ATPase